MMNLSKDDNPAFTKRFRRGMMMALLASFVIYITLVLLGAVLYFSIKYNW